MRSTKLERQRGISILEALIGGVATIIAMTGLMQVLDVGFTTGQLTTFLANLSAKTTRTVDRMATELAGAELGEITPVSVEPLSSSTITFRKASGFSGGATQYGDWMQFVMEPDPADPQDGADNDDDGSTDEQRVVLVVRPGETDERRTILVEGVSNFLDGEASNASDDNGNGLIDESGLSFDFEGDAIRVRLTLHDTGPDGNVYSRTIETSVTPRN